MYFDHGVKLTAPAYFAEFPTTICFFFQTHLEGGNRPSHDSKSSEVKMGETHHFYPFKTGSWGYQVYIQHIITYIYILWYGMDKM